METIVLASNNAHKIKELKEMLSGAKVLSMSEIGFHDDIVEDGKTFFENALIKAKTIHEYLKKKKIVASVISDDSGLCVDALDGAPGVYSARYAGGHGDYEACRNKLLENMKNKRNRKACFMCCIVKMFPDGNYVFAEGKTLGEITKQPLGSLEFCYDPVFYSNDLKKTFGEATSEEKNSVSHRARAIQQLLEICAKLKK